MMKKSVKKVITAAISLTMAAAIAVTPASAVYYSNSFAIDATGEEFAIPEAYRYYDTINMFTGGLGVLKAPTDICFDKDGNLFVVDKDNARILVMDGNGIIHTVIGSTMPDGEEQVYEDEEEEENPNPEEGEPEAQDNDESTNGDENLKVDDVVKDAQLERVDYTIEATSLDVLKYALSRESLFAALDGSLADGKSVETLTVHLAGDFNIDTLAKAALFNIEKVRYRYYYKNPDNPETNRLETVELTVNFEIPEGHTLTVGTALDMGETIITNKGKIVVTSNGRFDIYDSTLHSEEGELVQHYMGAIVNAQLNEANATRATIAEGTKATYIIDDTYSVNYIYMYLKAPEGICVDRDGTIYICDTDNHRIIIIDKDYSNITYYTQEMARQEAVVLGSEYNFSPSKIGVSMTGMMYILNKSNYRGYFTLNKDCEFCGFVGATKVTASVAEVFVQIFGSAAQRAEISNKQPAPATNLYVVDNMIYSVVKPSSTEPDPKRIMKINVVGSDLFPGGEYTISSYSTEKQERVQTNYVDVCVDGYGILTVLDNELGYIVQLNQLGEIIACFGGKSNRQGQFLLPTALDINPNNNRIYVADSLKGSIQIFEPTKFINLVHEASDMYFEGLYAEAVGLWQEVASFDETYDLAHVGIAESLYGEGKNVEAMEKFQYAWNYEGYDKAYSDFRLSLFRYYFAPVALSILALIVLLAFGFVTIKRKSDELYK